MSGVRTVLNVHVSGVTLSDCVIKPVRLLEKHFRSSRKFIEFDFFELILSSCSGGVVAQWSRCSCKIWTEFSTR